MSNLIVGSAEWAKFHSGNVSRKVVTRNSMFATSKKRARFNNSKRSPESMVRNSAQIDKILDFTHSNGWQQIDGGQYHLKWINNTYYKNKIFDSGKIYEFATGETHYFPIGDAVDDPEGVAMHYRTGGAGSYRTVHPNSWMTLPMTRSGKRREKTEKYRQRRRKIKEEFKKGGQPVRA